MKASGDLDLLSPDTRYALDYMCYLAWRRRPERVHIASRQPAVCMAVIRRLKAARCRISVSTPEIQAAARAQLGLTVSVRDDRATHSEVVLYPFSLEQGVRIAMSPHMIAVVRNSLSYKRLLYPRAEAMNIMTLVRALRRRYSISVHAGVFHPLFLTCYGAALLAERLSSWHHFLLVDRAMSRLFLRQSPLWRFSYIVILSGERSQ